MRPLRLPAPSLKRGSGRPSGNDNVTLRLTVFVVLVGAALARSAGAGVIARGNSRSRLVWRRNSIVLPLVVAGSAAAAPPPVIHWIAQRPAVAAARPPLAPLCQAADLRAHLFLQGATGSLVGGVDLLNAGTDPCSLVGWPAVSFDGRATASERWRVKKLAA